VEWLAAAVSVGVGVVVFVPIANALRTRRREPRLTGSDARAATLRFGLVFIPLALLVMLGVDRLFG
jgi:hypothetical protein